jgi:hypothetical protein
VFVNAKVRAELFHYLFREATGNNCEAFVFDALRDVMEHRYEIIATGSLTKTILLSDRDDERNRDVSKTKREGGVCQRSAALTL